MSSLRFDRVCFAHTDAAPLFEQLSFQLDRGWTGVVGPNGAGKTTLLRLISGELLPTEGLIHRGQLTVVRVDQRDEAPSPEVVELVATGDAAAWRLHGALGLDPAEVERWTTLSFGERRRWQVAGALWREPELLLLDEPSNHLDAKARDWLLEALRGFKGIGLLASHDRTLLEALTTRTLRVTPGQVRLHAGSYRAAKAEWELERSHAIERKERADRQVSKARQQLHAARAEQRSIDQQRGGARLRSKYDNDSRGLLAQFAISQAEKKAGRVVEVTRRQLESAEATRAGLHVGGELGAPIAIPVARGGSSIAAHRPEGPLIRGGRVLAEVPGLTVHRGEHVALLGPNGAGKTSLLEELQLGGEVLSIPQETTPEEAAALVEELKAWPRDARGRALSIVAALGVDPDRLLASVATDGSLSPGEVRKLRLAVGLSREASLLVLDEPTNHLDLPSVERLEAALRGYPGAVILVTHDDRLAELASIRWRLESGALRVE